MMGTKPDNDESPKAGDSDQTTTWSATQHVGRTLESEGIFKDVGQDVGPDVEDGTLNSGESGQDLDPVDALEVRTIDEDKAYQRSAREADEQTAQGDASSAEILASADENSFVGISRKLQTQPEPLHTRLAGDTSSDPHTDLGADNATTVQARTDGTQTKDTRHNR